MDKIDRIGTAVANRVRRYSQELYGQFRPPHGLDPLRDIRLLTKRSQLAVILDVGANVGQSSLRFARAFPDARIYAFEPSERTFAALRRTVHKHSHVRCVRLALGAQAPLAAGMDDVGEGGSFPPQSTTVTAFCAEEGIGQVDLLKVDTQGSERSVLAGAESLLTQQSIVFVQVQVQFMTEDEAGGTTLQAYRQYMLQRGYTLFGLYEQTVDERSGRPCLTGCQALFISQRELAAVHARHCVEQRASRRE